MGHARIALHIKEDKAAREKLAVQMIVMNDKNCCLMVPVRIAHPLLGQLLIK